MGTAAGLSCYLNHRHRRMDHSGAIYRRLVSALGRAGAHYHDSVAQADFFEPEACKRLMEEDLLAAGGSLLYHSLLDSITRADDQWEATFLTKGANIRIRCRYLIDATGDGDAAVLAGAQMTHGRSADQRTQPMTMIVQLGGFDPEAWTRSGGRMVDGRYANDGDCFETEIQRASAAGEWTIPRKNIAMMWAMPGDPTRVTVNGTRINGLNACNPVEFTRAEVEGRRQAAEILDFFRKYIPGFGDAYLLQTGPQIGVRETRRIVGRATLTEQDVRASMQPESTVVFCSYPIDVHQPDGSDTWFEKGGPGGQMYGIPWGCLLPAGVDNLVVAGRCISATHEAAGSFRVMPTCMGLGEAAGTAVALAAATGAPIHEVDAATVRSIINERRQSRDALKPAALNSH
jgi:hypothetical protein